MKLQTRLQQVHPVPKRSIPAVSPIFQSVMFEYANEEDYHDLQYLRLNTNPSHEILQNRIAQIEEAEASLVSTSGMATISSTLLTLLKKGDHILVQNCLYGGTTNLISEDLTKLGIDYDFVDTNMPDEWHEKLRPSTRIFYIESITNPMTDVPHFKEVVKFSKKHNLISIIDNTVATPVNFLPLKYGFDLCIHSCTKSLNGHDDIVAGVVSSNEDLIRLIKTKQDHLGGCLDPHAAFLLNRGLHTLSLRVEYQNKSALKLATFLENDTAIEAIYYPGLKSHPNYEVAKSHFKGFGSLMSIELKGGEKAADYLIKHLTIPLNAVSLGGVKTLVIKPGRTTHNEVNTDLKDQIGVSNSLVRISVGIEETSDLIQDFAAVLQRIQKDFN